METQNVQLDKAGHYSVLLGSITSQGLPADEFFLRGRCAGCTYSSKAKLSSPA
jgi:hypothetical protein